MGLCLWTLALFTALSASLVSVNGATVSSLNASEITTDTYELEDAPVDNSEDLTEDMTLQQDAISRSGDINESLTSESSGDKSTSDEDDDDSWSEGGRIGPVAIPRPDNETSKPDNGERPSFPPETEIPSSNAWIASKGLTKQFTKQGWIPVGVRPPTISNYPTVSFVPTVREKVYNAPNNAWLPSSYPLSNQQSTKGQPVYIRGKFPSVTPIKSNFAPMFRFLPMAPAKIPSRSRTVNEFPSVRSQIYPIPVSSKYSPPMIQPPLHNWVLQGKPLKEASFKPIFSPVPFPVPQVNQSEVIQSQPVVITDKMRPQIVLLGPSPNVGMMKDIFRYPNEPGLFVMKDVPILPQQNLFYTGYSPFKNQNYFIPSINPVRQQHQGPTSNIPLSNDPSEPPSDSDSWVIEDKDLNSNPTCVITPPESDYPSTPPKVDGAQIRNDGSSPKIIQPSNLLPLPFLTKYINPYILPAPVRYVNSPPMVMNGSSFSLFPLSSYQNAPFIPPRPNYYIPSQPNSVYLPPMRRNIQTVSSQFSSFLPQYLIDDTVNSDGFYTPSQPGPSVLGTFGKNSSKVLSYPFPLSPPIVLTPNQPSFSLFPQKQVSYGLPLMRSFTSIQDILDFSGMPYYVKGIRESRPPSAQPDFQANVPEGNRDSGTAQRSTQDSVPSPPQPTEAPEGENSVTKSPPPPQFRKFPQKVQFVEFPIPNPFSRKPYSFGYDQNDGLGTLQHREEIVDSLGVFKGSYGLRDGVGLYRVVDYVANKGGYRAMVRTTDPGFLGPRGQSDPVRPRQYISYDYPYEVVIPAGSPSAELKD